MTKKEQNPLTSLLTEKEDILKSTGSSFSFIRAEDRRSYLVPAEKVRLPSEGVHEDLLTLPSSVDIGADYRVARDCDGDFLFK